MRAPMITMNAVGPTIARAYMHLVAYLEAEGYEHLIGEIQIKPDIGHLPDQSRHAWVQKREYRDVAEVV